MPTIFISHASADNAAARALKDWIVAAEFQEPFVDLDGLIVGDKWEDELKRQIGACRIVACLVTPAWLGSPECVGEFRAASYQHGKKILPLLLGVEHLFADPAMLDERDKALAKALAKVLRIDQALSLDAAYDQATGLAIASVPAIADELTAALKAAGADAKAGLTPETFSVDRNAVPEPFPGLVSFDDTEAGAAVFYGRSPEIAECLEALRAMRGSGKRAAFVILGASGSGKSSLMKAGVVTRLRKEPAWIGLRAFRPGGDPLANFANSLEKTLVEAGVMDWAAGAFIDEIKAVRSAADRDESGALTENGIAALRAVLDTAADLLRKRLVRDEATILVPIDQGEELARGQGDSSDALGELLLAMTAGENRGEFPEWLPMLTVRSDSFPELQQSARFVRIQDVLFNLKPLRIIRFDDVIEGPAERYDVNIETGLVEAMTDDAPATDALPLLAFAMQRLWRLYHRTGEITRAHYEGLGKISGLMQDAAERALAGLSPDDDAPRRDHRPAQLKLGAQTFVPALADINEDGAAIRRVAQLGEFNEDAQRLLKDFADWRLVVIRAGGNVEVAHEALFRDWPRLAAWIEPEKHRLAALRGLQRDAKAYAQSGKSKDLVHRWRRLREVRDLRNRPAWRERLSPVDERYLEACGKRQRRDRVIQTSAAVVLAAAVSGAIFPEEVRRTVRQTYVSAVMQVRTAYALNFQVRELSVTAIEDLKPGDSFRDCSIYLPCPDWLPEVVVLPAGEFEMGSDQGLEDQRPVHRVSVDRFAVARFELTHGQWQACVEMTDQSRLEALQIDMERTGSRTGCAPVSDDGFGRGDRPVINVSWREAQGYVAWLNKMVAGDADNGPYRLLSEAEWEYAARAGSTTSYSWGPEQPVCEKGAPNGAVFMDCGDRGARPVGFSAANGFGLHDMHGNVWEWTQDCWNKSYAGAPVDGAAWEAGDCSLRVLRGGSWLNSPQFLRSAYRNRVNPTGRKDTLGFRVARTLSPPTP